MLKNRFSIATALVAFAACLMGCGSSDKDVVVVQNVDSGSFDGTSLNVRGSPLLVYFSEGPGRKVGQMDYDQFKAAWEHHSEWYGNNPPNATISIQNGSDKKVKPVVLLRSPKIEGNQVTYEAELIEGVLPPNFGHASLFIEMKDFDTQAAR